MNKKLKFDLEMLSPEQLLRNIVEDAGYTFGFDYNLEVQTDWSVRCNEMATCKEDVIKFVNKISEVTGLEFIIDCVHSIYNDDLMVFYTKDLTFGEEVYLAKNKFDWSCYLGLAYSKKGEVVRLKWKTKKKK